VLEDRRLPSGAAGGSRLSRAVAVPPSPSGYPHAARKACNAERPPVEARLSETRAVAGAGGTVDESASCEDACVTPAPANGSAGAAARFRDPQIDRAASFGHTVATRARPAVSPATKARSSDRARLDGGSADTDEIAGPPVHPARPHAANSSFAAGARRRADGR
jgi:hypothetical protein